ncbi:MAG: hypothetical protein AB7F40_06615 [Victivallaceae bacterium]|nr:hypothetical protein [Victivallaceae bacterium]
MRRFKIFAVSGLLTATLCGCQSNTYYQKIGEPGTRAPFQVFDSDSFAAGLRYDGFTIDRMNNPAWQAPAAGQSKQRAIWSVHPEDGKFHTIYAAVTVERLPPAIGTPEEFKKYVDAEYNTIPPRFKLISYSSEMTAFDGIPAVKFRQITAELANPKTDKKLKMTFSGYAVMTDPENKLFLEIVFSERDLFDRLSETPNPLEEEFFKAVHISPEEESE